MEKLSRRDAETAEKVSEKTALLKNTKNHENEPPQKPATPPEIRDLKEMPQGFREL